MSRIAKRTMPPRMPTVSALVVASCVLAPWVSPTAAPAALKIAVSSVAMPTATSHPKNAEPQCSPPKLVALALLHLPDLLARRRRRRRVAGCGMSVVEDLGGG